MAGKNIIITGANSGIGFATAQHFSRAGANVILACRNHEKAERAQAEICRAVPGASTRIIRLDVSDPESVRHFVRDFADQVGQLDILINNAGIVAIPLTRNSAGHEMQLATNYLGAFALTGLLLPYFLQDAPGRIVNVGSLAHRFGKLDPDDLDWERTPYGQWKSYANSQLASMSHTLELNRRLAASGSRVIALGAHPGFARTNISQNSPTLTHTNPVAIWFDHQLARLIPSATHAARPIILAAEDEDARGGDYYGPGGFLEIGGKPARARVNPVARDVELGKRLWTVSEKMTGVEFLSDF